MYWTLAIEFQWYLLVGLIFPLLATRNRPLRFLGITSLMAAFYLIPYYKFVFHSIPIFLIGVFVFQYRAQLISLLEMFGLIAVMAFAMWHPIGWIVAAVATFTGLIIALVTFELRALDRVGDVSYSLYLLHLPIGITLIGCLSRWLPYSGSYLVVLDALGWRSAAWRHGPCIRPSNGRRRRCRRRFACRIPCAGAPPRPPWLPPAATSRRKFRTPAAEAKVPARTSTISTRIQFLFRPEEVSCRPFPCRPISPILRRKPFLF